MVRKFHFSFNLQLLCITLCTIKKILVSLAEALTDLSISYSSLLAVSFFFFFFAKARFVWEKFKQQKMYSHPFQKWLADWQILAVLASGVKMDVFQISQKL